MLLPRVAWLQAPMAIEFQALASAFVPIAVALIPSELARPPMAIPLSLLALASAPNAKDFVLLARAP